MTIIYLVFRSDLNNPRIDGDRHPFAYTSRAAAEVKHAELHEEGYDIISISETKLSG